MRISYKETECVLMISQCDFLFIKVAVFINSKRSMPLWKSGVIALMFHGLDDLTL